MKEAVLSCGCQWDRSSMAKSGPVGLDLDTLEEANGGVIFGPFLVAYAYYGATGVAYTAGFYAGAGLAVMALVD